ncbi:MAG: taurine dioxygenase [Deltaproteobacteria bacterium]|nr:MAG: taurine dioxygenase [Deltaproteobacteria bacterium]
MTVSSFKVRPTAGALGAEVQNIDLRKSLSDEEFGQLHQALLEYQVLFFRDQDITPKQHRDLALRFGELLCHPAYPTPEGFPEVTILEHSAEKPSKIEVWHADMTFRPQPPLGSILQAKVVPARGGDTLWASMSAAYEALSPAMQSFLEGLTAVHDFKYGFKESLAEPGGYERLKQAVEDNPPQIHPVVRVHPESGRKSLFVNALFTTHIVELSAAESRAVLAYLFEHMVQPEFTCRFYWEPNSIAFWDNRITMHKPVNDHGLQERVLQRVVILGDTPKGPTSLEA